MSEISKVKQAVARGYRTTKAIAEAAGLTTARTQTYLMRLKDQGLVASETPLVERRMGRWYRMTSGVLGRPIKHYHMVGVGFLLQDIWRGWYDPNRLPRRPAAHPPTDHGARSRGVK